jgi:hypothetical protein
MSDSPNRLVNSDGEVYQRNGLTGKYERLGSVLSGRPTGQTARDGLEQTIVGTDGRELYPEPEPNIRPAPYGSSPAGPRIYGSGYGGTSPAGGRIYGSGSGTISPAGDRIYGS